MKRLWFIRDKMSLKVNISHHNSRAGQRHFRNVKSRPSSDFSDKSPVAEGRIPDDSRALLEDAPCGYVILDEAGFIKQTNRRFRSMAGIAETVILGPFTGLLERNYLPSFLDHLRRCRNAGNIVTSEAVLCSRDGRKIPVRLLSLPSRSSSGAEWFATMVIDDTERREKELELRRQEQEYRDFVDSIEGIVWEMDAASGHCTYVNKQVERLLGYPVEQWTVWDNFWQTHLFVEDRERVLNERVRAANARKNFVCEYRIIAADRRLVWLRDSVTVRELNGRIKLRGVALDITDRKMAEEKLREVHEQLEVRVAERTKELQWTIAELESFSYTLSHDLRAPLRAMQGYAQILRDSSEHVLKDEAKEFLRRIMASSERMDALVQDVLKYNSLSQTPIDLQPVDLDTLLRAIIAEYPLFQAPNVEIEVIGQLPKVVAHEGFLTQCISNLLSNAVKFVAPGVKPQVRIDSQPLNDHTVQIWFEDNGIGIAPEHQRRIFGIFQRLNSTDSYEGTGVGLAIVQRTIERMNGHVGVESTLGEGSKFWMQLQLA